MNVKKGIARFKNGLDGFLRMLFIKPGSSTVFCFFLVASNGFLWNFLEFRELKKCEAGEEENALLIETLKRPLV